MSQSYAVIFERAENNWAAYVPDLPGCITTDCTLEETERNIREAIQGHMRTLREFGEPVPSHSIVAREVEVTPSTWRPQFVCAHRRPGYIHILPRIAQE